MLSKHHTDLQDYETQRGAALKMKSLDLFMLLATHIYVEFSNTTLA